MTPISLYFDGFRIRSTIMPPKSHPKYLLAALLLCSTALAAQTPAADTTIAGQTYTVLPVETLIAQLRGPADGPRATHRQVAFRGRLFAPTAGLDTVRVALDCADVHFLDEVSFSQVVFLAPVLLTGVDFAGGLSLAGAHLAAPFALRDSRTAKHATFQQARFDRSADFTASHFAGVASFGKARFAGTAAAFAQAKFAGAAYFEEAEFTAPAEFTDAAFAGVAAFKATTWARSLSFAGARFADQAQFWDARFASAATFASGRADGEVAFDRARFTGPTSFAGFIFAQAARFRTTRFGRADFTGAYFRKEADFNNAEATTVDLRAIFNRSLDLSRANFAQLDLRVADADSTFADGAQLYLQQPRLGRVFARWSQLQSHLATNESGQDLIPAYAALRQQLLLQGLDGDAEACLIERLDYQRLRLSWGEPKRWAMELWHLSSNYGTDPLQLVIFILGSILIFGLVYRCAASAMRPICGEGQPTRADCIVFSIYTFTRSGDRAWYASGKLKLLVSVEALLGWIALGLLIAVALAHLL